MRAIVLKDITPVGWGPCLEPFIRHRSFITYDKRRGHQLIYQQGDRYGTVGDRCYDMPHEELLALVRDGYVRLERGR